LTGDRLFYGLLWLALIGYALLRAPPPAPDTLERITALALLDTSRVDPAAIAVFNLLGVLPTAFLAILLYDTGRPSPWPFALGGYVLGGIVLLPYLALRDTRKPLDPAPGRFGRAAGSRITGGVLLLVTAGLLGYGLVAGSPAVYAEQARHDQFFAVMGADLIALTVALHRAAATDRRRRAITLAGPLATLVRVPLLGPLLYLASRPPPATMAAP